MNMEYEPKPNQHQFIDLDGQRFNRWVVMGFAGSDGKHSWWHCKCDCGTVKRIASNALRSGKSSSCGCYANELTGQRSRTHNMRHTPEFSSWASMKQRCYNPNEKAYVNYGGRGIKVCDRWLHSFENFFADMGPRISAEHTIERIDVNGNYEPSNCRWATRLEQSVNTRRTLFVEIQGQRVSLAVLCRTFGCHYMRVYKRLFFRKMSLSDALEISPERLDNYMLGEMKEQTLKAVV